MNYCQPTYARASQKSVLTELTQRFGTYQIALSHALELEAISDGAYRKDATVIMHMHSAQDRKDSVQHAMTILDLLEIESASEFYEYRPTITAWFSNTIFHKNKEYVMCAGVWYERTWTMVKVKSPKHTHGIIYSKDFHVGQSEDAGLSLCLNDGNSTLPLKYGRAMERLTKRIKSEQTKFTRTIRLRGCDGASAEKLRKHSLKISEQYLRDRTVHINECAREILTATRFVVYCGPTTKNDERHYIAIGMAELVSFFELLVLMTRKSKTPITFIKYDTRMLRSTYDRNKHGHEAIARLITGGVKQFVATKL